MDTAETSSEAAGANIITVPFEERKPDLRDQETLSNIATERREFARMSQDY